MRGLWVLYWRPPLLFRLYTFLGAFGIPQLGRGDSSRLLQHYKIEELPTITVNDIEDIDGFAEVSARDIIKGLVDKWSTINHMLNLGFNLSKTQLLSQAEEIESPIAG